MKELSCFCKKPIQVDDTNFENLSQYAWDCSSGSVQTTIQTTKGLLRLSIASFIIDIPDGYVPDHKDRNEHNNLVENLRPATHSQNQMNKGKQRNNKSGYKGVWWEPLIAIWRWEVRKDKKVVARGKNLDLIEAARARDRAAILWHGEFAYTNFPKSDYV